MLRRISEHDDPSLVAIVPLRPRLEAAPRTGVGLPSLSVGRHPSNDVVLNSTGIPLLLSRFHSSITFDGEQFTLVDRVNTNGTYVNAVQLPHLGQRILRVGDTVSFGGPANVLRDGVSLQNPFRFVFEEYQAVEEAAEPAVEAPPAAVVQALGEPMNRSEERAPTPSDEPAAAEQVPVAVPDASAGAPVVVPGSSPAPAAGAADESPAQQANGNRSRRRRREEEGVPVGVAAGPAEERPARRARVPVPMGLTLHAFMNAVMAADNQNAAVMPPADAAEPMAGVVGPPQPSAPLMDDEAGLPPAEPRIVAPLESDDIGGVCARLVSDAKCSVCFDLMVAPHALTCGHSFCGSCITAWLKKSSCCPVCRARTTQPSYERALDDILTAIVEPRLPAEEAAERHRRKVQWAAEQREIARAQRASAAARARGGISVERVNLNDLHRLVRDTQQLQQEVGRLRRIANANVGGATNAGGEAVEGAAGGGDVPAQAVYGIAVRVPGAISPRMVLMPGGMEGLLLPTVRPISAARARAIAAASVPQPAPVTVEWRIDAAPTALCVCHTCFQGIAQGDARVVHTTQQPSQVGAQARGDARLQAQTARAFFHLGCRLPPGSADVAGLDVLSVELRARVEAVLAARAAQAGNEGEVA